MNVFINKRKIILIIILLISSLLFLEFGSYIQQSYKLIKQEKAEGKITKIPAYVSNIEPFHKYYYQRDNRNIFLNSNNNPNFANSRILIFCDNSSNDNSTQSFSNSLSQKLKMPVYSLLNEKWMGIQHMYFLFKNESLMDSINPQTIIFIYDDNQRNKLVSFSFYPYKNFLNLNYKLQNNKLVEKEPLFLYLYNSYFIRNLERFIGWRISTSNIPYIQQKNFDVIQKLFEDSQKIAKDKYSNLQNFVILRVTPYNNTLRELSTYRHFYKIAEIEYNMWKTLQDEGFTIIDFSEIANIGYSDRHKYNTYDKSVTELLNKNIDRFINFSKIDYSFPKQTDNI